MPAGKRRTKGHLVVKSGFRASATSETEARASPARVGWLEKKAKGMRYQKRFFVASGHYLRYFRDETCEELLAVVDVIGATVQVRDDWIETLKTMILRGADKENLLLPDEEGLFIPYHDDESDDDDDDDISSVAAPAAKEKDDDDDDDAEEEEEEEEETVVVVDTKPPPPPASASTTSNCDCLRICGCGTTPQKSS